MTRKKKKATNLIAKFIYIIHFITCVLLAYLVTQINIIPNEYLLLIYSILLIFLIIIGLFMLNSRIKTGPKIFFIILSIILSCSYITGGYYINKTFNFLDNIQTSGNQSEQFYVLVKKDSGYHKIQDIKNIKMGCYLNNDVAKEALTKINKKVKTHNYTEEDYTNLAKSLLTNQTKAIFLSESYKNILDENYANFKDNVKILYTIKVTSKKSIEVSSVDITNHTFTIFVSGIDTYGKIDTVGRSDVNMLITVNPKTHKILLTSIPRDYYVKLHNTTGLKDKLTHAGMYGIDTSINTVEDLLNINIDYYAKVNFSSVVKLVNSIDGIDIYSDTSFYTIDNKYIGFGNNHLNGIEALGFARERHAYQTGDIHRNQNQQAVIEAIAKKVLSSNTLLIKYSTILDNMNGYFETNFDTNNISKLIKVQLQSHPSWTFDKNNITGFDSTALTYSGGSQQLYVMLPDSKSLNQATKKIKDLDN